MRKLFDNSLFRFLCRLSFKEDNSLLNIFDSSLESTLTKEEVIFFTKHGFLVKEKAVSDKFIDKILNTGTASIDNLDSLHFEEVKSKINFGMIPGVVIDRYGKVQLPLVDNTYIEEFFGQDSIVYQTVRHLIGSQRMTDSPNINGLYLTFPCLNSPLVTPYIHTDTGADVIRFIIYLSDVSEGSGGFHVWPGSHLQLRELYPSEVNSEPDAPKYWQTLYSMALKTPFVEIAAPAGTVIFWHHRLAHAAGINRSSSVRKVFIAGYSPSDVEYRDSLKLSENPWEHWNVSNSLDFCD